MWQKIFSREDETQREIPKGNARRGKAIYFEECGGCHTMFGDPATLEAPPLFAIMDRKAGASAYSYSRALKRSGIVWSDRNMFLFLGKPNRFLPSNRMMYGGLASAQKRADLIAYLRSYEGE